MIERVIENWLDKASEKAFQIPFCYLLINQGHTIIHMTRHCGMEHGKDIISKDKDGNICAYQLKGAPGSKIKLRDWQQSILGQINQLVFTPVSHPSIISGSVHKAYFVTNGGIEEEVSHAITAFNIQQEKQNLPYRINTIVDGELKNMAKKVTYAFLPADLKNFKSLLEFLLEDGNNCLNKPKFAVLLQSVLTDEPVSQSKGKERINSAALLTSIATSNHINENNHFAVYESWTIYIAQLLGYASSHQMSKNDWENEYLVAEQLAINALENLWDELKECKDFLTGNLMEDVFFHKAKRLLLIGLMANLGLHRLLNNDEFNHDELKNFIQNNLTEIDIWGESAMPHLIAVYWYLNNIGALELAVSFLTKVLENIIDINQECDGMIGPYYDIEACLSKIILHTNELETDKYQSFYIEGIINLLAGQNCKEKLRQLWPSITHFRFMNFNLQTPSDFYNWHNDTGKEISYLPKFTQEWFELLENSKESEGLDLPAAIKSKPILYPLLLSIMPHRVSASGIRWFDNALK